MLALVTVATPAWFLLANERVQPRWENEKRHPLDRATPPWMHAARGLIYMPVPEVTARLIYLVVDIQSKSEPAVRQTVSIYCSEKIGSYLMICWPSELLS